ncbi:hypothetical protein mRhiFer1_008176 [Rhinolophus ferrumequinum]|uniref:Uncharacterized protein n=1 Tax=Rhinolophus ferrumequinum TaxID=59479 RepID=A0A7J7W880_RHIFE|nr:hypothetical protein mRhiFer1_008176 [Rhinolophus ferrumequinum]
MLYLIDQYNLLYSKPFAIFLSEVSNNKLRQVNLNDEWMPDKLWQWLTRNPQNKSELYLLMLRGLPNTVFDLIELEVLKFELILDMTIRPSIAQLIRLQKQWLYHTVAKIQAHSLVFLWENMWSLHITDIKKIPV